ncbi:MAG TPA: VOC family protein [Steroidobacteraceae bacterium]|nr:VOC family protein [Steroidobacteraceae bacterium]
MKPTPRDWPRISGSVFYQDAAAAIDWLCAAFGFEVRLKVEGDGGRIEHSELTYGEGLIMVSQESPDSERLWKRSMRSPKSLGGASTQSMMIFVDDAQAHCAHARGHGARIVEEPATHDYGEDYWTDLSYGALDLEGHLWWITQRLRDPPAGDVTRTCSGA